MYQPFHEKIAVAGVYKAGRFTPKWFYWRKKMYHVSEVTLRSDIKDGEVKKRLFSLVASGNVYRLEFNRDTEQWWLEEVWYD